MSSDDPETRQPSEEETLAQPEVPAPPAGEEVHIPGPTVVPLLTAVGITLAVTGITISHYLLVIGIILTIVCVVRWVRQTRHEVDELPLE